MDIQGHRGCRGIRPENTIPAFLHAIQLGVNTLEMDAVISADGKVIISHEPFMNHEMCLQADGSEIKQSAEESFNVYKHSYEALKAFDCGLKPHPRFPDQKKMPCHKPSLKDVVLAVNQKILIMEIPSIRYNIEIKRKKKWDFTHHPPYQEFADIVISTIIECQILELTTVQCFDFETLQYINRKYPMVDLVMLIEDSRSPERCIEDLGFFPKVYSPSYELVDKMLVSFCKRNNMLLIPWTVNEEADIQNLIDMGVTSLISDYPDRVINLMNNPAS